MPDPSGDQREEPGGSPPTPPGDVPASDAERKRSWRKKSLTPLGLFILGLLLLLGAWLAYPSTAQVPNAALIGVSVSTNVPVALISYTVEQGPPAGVLILVSSERMATPHGAPPTAEVSLIAPYRSGHSESTSLNQTVTFHSLRGFLQFAEADFSLNVPSFGATYNGVTASASIPRVDVTGPGTPELNIQYYLPNASSYDWSSFPYAQADSREIQWVVNMPRVSDEARNIAQTPGQVAVGIDHNAQADNDTWTFIAGALLGLGGGAILSSVQEALHALTDPAPPNTSRSGPDT